MDEFSVNVKQISNHIVIVANNQEDAIQQVTDLIKNQDLALVEASKVQLVEPLGFGYAPIDCIDDSVVRVCNRAFKSDVKDFAFLHTSNALSKVSDNKIGYC